MKEKAFLDREESTTQAFTFDFDPNKRTLKKIVIYTDTVEDPKYAEKLVEEILRDGKEKKAMSM